jgi:hypothetical protein
LRKAEIGRVLDIVGLAADGGRRVGTYSLGMRQRLGVARALLGGPKLLILDEPTNGLDPDGIRDMRALISTLPEREGVTLFVSSHVLAEVEQTATHIALMDKGRLVAQGAIASLRDGARKRVSITVRQPGRLVALLAEAGIDAAETGGGRVAIAALALGCIRACLELSTEYAKQRTSFGVPIGRKQGVAFQIADLDVMAAAAHQLVYAAAAMRDHGAGAAEFNRAAAIAKLYATESAVTATRVATQIFGGYGFMEEYPVARFYRDAKVLEIGEGTSEVQRLLIARRLGLPVE